MKFVFQVVVFVVVLTCVGYYGSAFVMPSVTIENQSGAALKRVEVMLPGSKLNFGPMNDGDLNTLHYSLNQNDGVYNYQFEDENAVVEAGFCGAVTGYDIHKRTIITIHKNNQVNCR